MRWHDCQRIEFLHNSRSFHTKLKKPKRTIGDVIIQGHIAIHQWMVYLIFDRYIRIFGRHQGGIRLFCETAQRVQFEKKRNIMYRF